ncbi:uncharacterized protein LAJ45_07393 [Morchella importuna]|uniref:uncharacterized protein n=1 Tax=Morchella importuna TaxID=1174673 RepID=UPI001E8E1C55|nr:uncharacterized protein LAJ45_07393 [Morchella importuna]KAH8148682.1 hypothetical protein LAJ45_07393 [Morchella importuna]
MKTEWVQSSWSITRHLYTQVRVVRRDITVSFLSPLDMALQDPLARAARLMSCLFQIARANLHSYLTDVAQPWPTINITYIGGPRSTFQELIPRSADANSTRINADTSTMTSPSLFQSLDYRALQVREILVLEPLFFIRTNRKYPWDIPNQSSPMKPLSRVATSSKSILWPLKHRTLCPSTVASPPSVGCFSDIQAELSRNNEACN